MSTPPRLEETVLSQPAQDDKVARQDLRAPECNGRADQRDQSRGGGGPPPALDQAIHRIAVRPHEHLPQLSRRLGVLVVPVLVAFHRLGGERARQVRDRPQMRGGERRVQQLRVGGLGVEGEVGEGGHEVILILNIF